MKRNCQIYQWYQNNPFAPSRMVFEHGSAEPDVEDPEGMTDTIRKPTLHEDEEPIPPTQRSARSRELTTPESTKRKKIQTATSVRSSVGETLEDKVTRLEEENKELREKLAESENAYKESNKEIIELKNLIRVDKVTKALTRNTIEKEIEARMNKITGSREEGRRSKEFQHLSILFVDMDNFKKVNDGLDHKIGDAALMEFVQLIKSNIRKDGTDLVGKYGGDEFIIILDGASEEDAVKKSRRTSSNCGKSTKGPDSKSLPG